MIHPDQLAKAIEITGSRYSLCILLAKRTKQIHSHRQWTSAGLGASVRQAIDDILARRIAFSLPEGGPTPLLLAGKETELTDYALLSLYALARVNIEDDGRVCVNNDYWVQAGVSSTSESDFASQAFDIEVSSPWEKIPFDFLIHLTGHLKLVGECHKRLYYDPLNSDPQLVDFKFKVLNAGSNVISVDCYHNLRWLRTFEFTFESVEIALKAVA